MSLRHSTERLSDMIKAEAMRLGFYRCGIAEATAVTQEAATRYMEWLHGGRHADMAYMARHADLRIDPRLLMPGAKSMVCVALSYAPPTPLPPTGYNIAAYALGRDYHDLMRERLALLAQFVAKAALQLPHVGDGQEGAPICRVCCDTAPVLERHWAAQAGIGFIGRNSQLIIPGAGSMFFLGEVITTLPLAYDSPMAAHCGHCHACIDACPTAALSANGGLDARRCLSYLTIESRSPLPPEAAKAMGGGIYGCDRCQAACPHNRHAPLATAPELMPSAQLLAMTKNDWHSLTIEQYRQLFKGSAVKRAKYDGLMRNIRAAQSNEHDAPSAQ